MLTKQEKEHYRGTIFRHLDGIATATTAHALENKGILNYLLEHKKVNLDVLCSEFKANDGYLNVALRVLCSQGWLVQHLDNDNDTISYEINDNSQAAFDLVPLYGDVTPLLNYATTFPYDHIGPDAFIMLERLFKKHEGQFGLTDIDNNTIEKQIFKHLEGVIVGPIVVMLGLSGLFHKYFMEASFRAQEFHKDPESFKKDIRFLRPSGLVSKKERHLPVYRKGFILCEARQLLWCNGIIFTYFFAIGRALIWKSHGSKSWFA